MEQFKGFSTSTKPGTPLPDTFFSELLPIIDTVEELKVILYVFWKTNRQEKPFPYVKRTDLLQDQGFMQGLGKREGSEIKTLEQALARAVRRGALLTALIRFKDEEKPIFLVNSPRGQAALDAVRDGTWDPGAETQEPAGLDVQLPNIYRIYEENIGPLTPMIAEALKEAETLYPTPWIEEAIRIAVENNVRRWRYAEAILQRWHEKGKDERKVRGDSEKDRRRYIHGEFSEFVEH